MNTLTLTGRDAPTVQLDWADLVALDNKISGSVLTPEDPDWDEATLLWNGMVTKRPAFVVRPADARDVCAIVDLARERGLELSVKCGGHNIGGTAVADGGLMVDMSRLREVRVDPERRLAYVGGGCLLKDVDRATQVHGLATTLGFISEVGVGGLVLGGGFGYLARRFGWAVDNLEEVEIVTADGRLRVANRNENPDLWWAVRGGGGNFGIVTRFVLRLHEVGPTVFGGLIAWPFDRIDEVMAAYRRLTDEAPRELTAFMVMFKAPPAPFVPTEWVGRRIVAMTVCYSGDLTHTEEALAPLRALGEPVFDLLEQRPYTTQQSYLDETEPKGMHYYWQSEFTSGLTDEMLTACREEAAACPAPDGQVVIAHIGGAINDRAWDDGAIGNRDVRFVFGADAMFEPGEPRAAEYVAWVRKAARRFRAFSTGGTYVNFQTVEDGDARLRATYGPNWERLVEVKRRYDPDNLFRTNRNIDPRGTNGTRA